MFAVQHPSLRLNHMLYSYEGPHHWISTRDRYRATLEAEQPYKRITRHLYGNQISNGILKFGGDRVRTDLAGHVLKEGIDVSHGHICEVIPAVRSCEVLGSWSGTMPFTPDQKLILGSLLKQACTNSRIILHPFLLLQFPLKIISLSPYLVLALVFSLRFFFVSHWVCFCFAKIQCLTRIFEFSYVTNRSIIFI